MGSNYFMLVGISLLASMTSLADCDRSKASGVL